MACTEEHLTYPLHDNRLFNLACSIIPHSKFLVTYSALYQPQIAEQTLQHKAYKINHEFPKGPKDGWADSWSVIADTPPWHDILV
jgi:hypothetical protein